jgi:hypothetical protein
VNELPVPAVDRWVTHARLERSNAIGHQRIFAPPNRKPHACTLAFARTRVSALILLVCWSTASVAYASQDGPGQSGDLQIAAAVEHTARAAWTSESPTEATQADPHHDGADPDSPVADSALGISPVEDSPPGDSPSADSPLLGEPPLGDPSLGESPPGDEPSSAEINVDPLGGSFADDLVSHLGLDATRRTDLARLDAVSRSAGAGPRRVDRVVIRKSSRLMWLELGGERVATYQIALGSNPEGPKRFQGDGRTPEGTYEIDFKNPDSEFFLSLHISYPNKADIAFAEAHDRDPGGNIAIHGIRNGLGWMGGKFRKQDWTDGCIAVTDDEMLELWELIDVGTRVVIEP